MKQRERASLIAILDEQAKSITSKWDAIVQVLEKASGKNSTKETHPKDSFKELKTRFLDLHKKHIAAVMHRDVHLAHELTGTIYEVLENFRETVLVAKPVKSAANGMELASTVFRFTRIWHGSKL